MKLKGHNFLEDTTTKEFLLLRELSRSPISKCKELVQEHLIEETDKEESIRRIKELLEFYYEFEPSSRPPMMIYESQNTWWKFWEPKVSIELNLFTEHGYRTKIDQLLLEINKIDVLKKVNYSPVTIAYAIINHKSQHHDDNLKELAKKFSEKYGSTPKSILTTYHQIMREKTTKANEGYAENIKEATNLNL